MTNLSSVYFDEARYVEAEALLKQSISIVEGKFGPRHPTLATALKNLARIYQDRNQYALAEPLLKRALDIEEQFLGKDHPHVSLTLNNLGGIYYVEARYAEAASAHERALAIRRRKLPPDHPDIAQSLENLGAAYEKLGRAADDDRLKKEALDIQRRSLGARNPLTACTLTNLAISYVSSGREADAEAACLEAIAIHEGAPSEDPGRFALVLGTLAGIRRTQGRLAEALALADRAVELTDQSAIAVQGGIGAYGERANILWDLGRKPEAVTALRRALDRAETQRANASGGEMERAHVFGQFTSGFAGLTHWENELGNIDKAFEAIERCRTRSLLDQFEMQGIDLLAGVPVGEAAALRRRQTAAQVEIASLRQQRRALDERPAGSNEERAVDIERIAGRLKEAQAKLVEIYRDIRSVSPAFRLSAGKNLQPAPLSALQEWVDSHRAVWLQYMMGNDSIIVCVVRPGVRAKLINLSLDEMQAAAVGLEAGPLSESRLESLMNVEGQALSRLLSTRDGAEHAIPRLALLWKVLVPEEERRALVSGDAERLVIVPDGPLALVPFETLAVELDPKPKFLIEAGPPVSYAPSATVFFQLLTPSTATSANDARQPVLTVANPRYAAAPPPADTIVDQVATGGQYRSAGGALADLPYTGVESAWVAENFKKQGMAVAALRGELATEHNVRGNVEGRKLLHLACHGLADQAYGNFFGCLALTPGARAATNPADDGFLTLPEIYELNLKQCDLAILSACQTNYGPQQKGEGVWALSRGFLVAGARRVVASNWLVDDEAAASLISAFCADLAKAEGKGETPDHAAALHRAKRWVRKQDKWARPYYWGTFVLVGPN